MSPLTMTAASFRIPIKHETRQLEALPERRQISLLAGSPMLYSRVLKVMKSLSLNDFDQMIKLGISSGLKDGSFREPGRV